MEWEEFLGSVMRECGFTPAQVGEMTLAELAVLGHQKGEYTLGYAVALQRAISALTPEQKEELARRRYGG